MLTVTVPETSNKASRVPRQEASRQLVDLIADCQRRLEQDYFDDQGFGLYLQDDNPLGDGDEVVGEGLAGDVLLLLLSRLEEEPKAGWYLTYWGTRDRDGNPASVTTEDAEDARFYHIIAV